MSIEDRAPEIQEHYKWFEDNFPEVANSVFIYSLGKGETAESVASAENERMMRLKYGVLPTMLASDENKSYEERQMVDAILVRSALTPISANVSPTETGEFVAILSIANEKSVLALQAINPAFKEAFSHADSETYRMLTAYLGDQEKIHVVDVNMNNKTYEQDAQGKFSPLALLRTEAVGEAYATLSLLQRQQKGEFTKPVEPFLEQMRQMQRQMLPDSVTRYHAMVDEASFSAESWGREHGNDLKDMSPREMLEESRKIADTLSYPELLAFTAFEAHAAKNGSGAAAASSAWEREQWKQAEGEIVSVPFKNGDIVDGVQAQPVSASCLVAMPKPQ